MGLAQFKEFFKSSNNEQPEAEEKKEEKTGLEIEIDEQAPVIGDELLKNTTELFHSTLEIMLKNQEITNEQMSEALEQINSPETQAEIKQELIGNVGPNYTGNDQREKVVQKYIKQTTGITRLM